MSTRARRPLQRNAERKFPIRIRVKIPECGYGPKLEAMHLWLRQELGQGCYDWTGNAQSGQDAPGIYLPDIETARRLVARFELELLYIEDVKLV